MEQLWLIDPQPRSAQRGPLDSASEEALHGFQTRRLQAGASARSVAREVSQLRALVRASAVIGGQDMLTTLFADLVQLARIIHTPPTPISRSTGHARLLAAQQFIRVVRRAEGEDEAAALVALDRLLPGNPAMRWHVAGIRVGGSAARQRRRIPTLEAADLARLVTAAGDGKRAPRAARDRALIALYCFTGLRAEEVPCLKWEQVMRMVVPPGRVGHAVRVVRGGADIDLPLVEPALVPLRGHAAARGGTLETLQGAVFRTGRPAGRALSYRAAHDIVRDACMAAGLPPVDQVDLRAACAHWLRSQGLSDHEVASVLGLTRVRSVDRLLARHRAIEAQRSVRPALDVGLDHERL